MNILKRQKWILAIALLLATANLIAIIFDIRISQSPQNIIELRLNKFSKEKNNYGD